MATSKEYAYYMKGNKVAIVQKDYTLEGGLNYTYDPDVGGLGLGTGNRLWKSPKETIADGLELQYVYSPTFNLQSTGTEGTDFHRFLGWGSDGTNLLLFTYGAVNVVDLSGLFAADDWIYVSGSGRWSGLHQVSATGGATGILTLKTKCNLKPSKLVINIGLSADGNAGGTSAPRDKQIEAFKDAQAYRGTAYIFTLGASNPQNNGLFSLAPDTTSGQITFNNKITIDADGDYTSTAEDIYSETVELTIFNVFYEQISVYEGVEVLEDESFELDITRYQANAVTYYVKAKYAEDAGNIEMKEYFMREFRRMVEKHESSKIIDPRILQGYSHFR